MSAVHISFQVLIEFLGQEINVMAAATEVHTKDKNCCMMIPSRKLGMLSYVDFKTIPGGDVSLQMCMQGMSFSTSGVLFLPNPCSIV